MAEQTPARRRALMLIVLGVVLLGLLAMLLVGVLRGDETDQINPQNDQVIVLRGGS